MTEKPEPVPLVLDLWGAPPREAKDPRGRRAHRWSEQLAKNIALLKVRGATDEEIGQRVGLSVPTLKKYYFRELSDAIALVRQAVLAAQLDQALAGKSSQAKIVLAHLDKAELAETAYRAPATAGHQAPPRLGKKEQRQAAAEQVGAGVFAPGAAPGFATSH